MTPSARPCLLPGAIGGEAQAALLSAWHLVFRSIRRG